MTTEADSTARMTAHQGASITLACVAVLGINLGSGIARAIIASGGAREGECIFVRYAPRRGSAEAGFLSIEEACATMPEESRVAAVAAESRGAVTLCFDDGSGCLALTLEREP
jgi:hypothetical protein